MTKSEVVRAKKCVHPIFMEMVNRFEVPVFWKVILEDMAYGKFPCGICMRRNNLICHVREKEFCISIEDVHSSDMPSFFRELMNLLQKRLMLRSTEEKEKERRHLLERFSDTFTKASSNKDAGHVASHFRKRVIRESMLEEFILRKQLKYSLSKAVCRHLLSLLVLGLLFKTIQLTHMQITENKIVTIEGFSPSVEKLSNVVFPTEQTTTASSQDDGGVKMNFNLREKTLHLPSSKNLCYPLFLLPRKNSMKLHWNKFLTQIPSCRYM